MGTVIPLGTRLRVRRNHGHKQRAAANLLPNLLVPLVAAPQFALVEPHLVALARLAAGGNDRVAGAESGPISRLLMS